MAPTFTTLTGSLLMDSGDDVDMKGKFPKQFEDKYLHFSELLMGLLQRINFTHGNLELDHVRI